MVLRIEGGDGNGGDAMLLDETLAEFGVVARAERGDVDIDEIAALARQNGEARLVAALAETVAAALQAARSRDRK